MAVDEVRSLLAAVRARLWQQRFVAAARAALWATAGLLLAGVALHLATRRVGVDTLLWTVGAAWAVLLLRAALRRPAVADCALWADRHLHGQSAFGTLLEMRRAAPAAAPAMALRQLDAWATVQAPRSRQLLAQRREPSRLSRPALAALVCAALAGLVHTLWDGAAPQSRSVAANGIDAADGGTKTPQAAPPPAPTAEAGTAADAAEKAAHRQGAQVTQALPPTRRVDAGADAVFDPLAAVDAASAARAGASPASAPAAASELTPGQRGTAAAGGRAAGDAADDRAGQDLSRPGPALAPPRPPREGPRGQPRWQADSEEPGTYDAASPPAAANAAAAERAVQAAAAATPPPARDAAPLTPTETTYVQAWTRALTRKP